MDLISSKVKKKGSVDHEPWYDHLFDFYTSLVKEYLSEYEIGKGLILLSE